MSREDAQMKLRLPADLKEKLEKAAAENKRSMNAEVLQRLSESFNTSDEISTNFTIAEQADLKKYAQMLKENTLVLQELTLTMKRNKKKKDSKTD